LKLAFMESHFVEAVGICAFNLGYTPFYVVSFLLNAKKKKFDLQEVVFSKHVSLLLR
jgi:hypothetical protein